MTAGLEHCTRLQRLNLSHNFIHSLAGLAELARPTCSLSVLDVRGNRLTTAAELHVLTGIASLRDLRVATPPATVMVIALVSVCPYDFPPGISPQLVAGGIWIP